MPLLDFPVYDTPEKLELASSVVCIGNFDGVHLGHQMLLAEMQRIAQEQQLPAVVVTFHPHARMVFRQAKCLTSAAEKSMLLAQFQPSAVVMIPFSQSYAQTDKQVFLDQLAALHPHTIVVGEDFRFGYQRMGTLVDLAAVTENLEIFPLKGLPDTEGVGNRPIKSSRIRMLLAAHELESAQHLLGYPYFCLGTVVQGGQRGRTIGYPTANIQVDRDKLLPEGVFAVRCEVDGVHYQGMANVGARPSFADNAPALEVHLFDVDLDLYDKTIQVNFIKFLRTQIKFTGLDALKIQLTQDEQQARQVLGGGVGLE